MRQCRYNTIAAPRHKSPLHGGRALLHIATMAGRSLESQPRDSDTATATAGIVG